MNYLSKLKKYFNKGGLSLILKIILMRLDYLFFYKFNISITSYIYKNLENFKFNNNNIKTNFTNIFRGNLWGSEESRSGPGSNIIFASKYGNELKKIIFDFKFKSIFDAPCGDFKWMSQVLESININYIGGDIVNELISINKKEYDQKYKFIQIDITKNIINNVDLFHCRDCLFHFSYNDIKKTLVNFSNSKVKYILLSNHEGIFPNNDIETGGFRYLDLRKKPFKFKEPIIKIPDYQKDKIKKYIYLYKRKDIEVYLKNTRFD
jgi:hypothetical protein